MDSPIVVIVLLVVNLALVVTLLVRSARTDDPAAVAQEELARQRSEAALAALERELARVQQTTSATGERVDRQLAEQARALNERLSQFDARFAGFQALVTQDIKNNTDTVDRRLAAVNATLEGQLRGLRADSAQRLEEMRKTVDEKLQQTLNERITQSFRLVNERLRQVDQGLGEMKGLAQDVGGLKKVLSNVKTRGIVGEIQLGAILKDMLSAGQYEENVEVIPNSGRRVEFAVKLPGEGGDPIWLPIDAKFPGDAYERLRDAQEAEDAAAVEAAWRELERRLVQEAKDIREKYVAPPATTAFGILFLPFEGLYAEVVDRRGLVERLQRDHHVNVAGPSTMAALLNSLQMGFQTVAIQRRADEIQQVLAAVKTEFGKYQGMLEKAQRQLGTASKTIDELVGTRSRAMERRLRSVTELESLDEAEHLLGIDAAAEDDGAE